MVRRVTLQQPGWPGFLHRSVAMEQPLGAPDATDPLAAMMRRSAGGWVDRQLLKLLASLLADLPARLDRVDAMLELPWWRRLFG